MHVILRLLKTYRAGLRQSSLTVSNPCQVQNDVTRSQTNTKRLLKRDRPETVFLAATRVRAELYQLGQTFARSNANINHQHYLWSLSNGCTISQVGVIVHRRIRSQDDDGVVKRILFSHSLRTTTTQVRDCERQWEMYFAWRHTNVKTFLPSASWWLSSWRLSFVTFYIVCVNFWRGQDEIPQWEIIVIFLFLNTCKYDIYYLIY